MQIKTSSFAPARETNPDPMTQKRTTRSARYGQACRSCAKAKSRCVVRSDGNGCERCHRLAKECHGPEPRNRRHPNIIDVESHEQISSLEDRLQSMMALLQSRRDVPGGENLLSHGDACESQPRWVATMSTPRSPTLDSASVNGTAPDINIDNTVHSNVDDALTTSTTIFSIEQALQQPEELTSRCVDRFCSCLLPYLPFIQLDSDVTVERLRHERPLLLQAIVCVAWPVQRERCARAAELKRTLSEAALLNTRYNGRCSTVDCMVDLLLGLMVYIAWGWDHVQDRGSLSRLMMLCVSLVGEMHLDRSGPKEPHTRNLLAPLVQRQSFETEQRSCFERQRAVLGCFVLSSIVSGYFAHVDSMKWTPQLEETLVALSKNGQSSSDGDLALQVRLQLLSVKAVQLRDLPQQHQSQTQSPKSMAEVFSDAETLLAQLQGHRRTSYQLSRYHQQIHLAHTYYVELVILETIRMSSAVISRLNAPTTSNPSDASNRDMEYQRTTGYSDLSYMWQSVLAISACTSGLLSLSSDFVGISFLQWEQLTGCIVVLSQLECLEDPRINRAHARAVIDLPILLDRVADKLLLTAMDAGEEQASGIFKQLASGIRTFHDSIQSSLVEANQSETSELSNCGGTKTFTYQQGYFMNSKFWMDQLFID